VRVFYCLSYPLRGKASSFKQGCDAARKLMAQDIDPGENRKAKKATKQDRAASSFEVIAREWHGKFAPGWAPMHSSKIIRL